MKESFPLVCPLVFQNFCDGAVNLQEIAFPLWSQCFLLVILLCLFTYKIFHIAFCFVVFVDPIEFDFSLDQQHNLQFCFIVGNKGENPGYIFPKQARLADHVPGLLACYKSTSIVGLSKGVSELVESRNEFCSECCVGLADGVKLMQRNLHAYTKI